MDKPLNKPLNYLGQLRAYSLADLMLLLYATGVSSTPLRFWGAVILWIGFLAYLESVHHDKGREPVPSLSGWLLLLLELMWWKDSTTGYLFVVCSVCYARKKQRPWGLTSPFLRGLQALAVVGGIAGYGHIFPWLAALLTTTRNWLGDVRDSSEDAKEGIWTWPVKFGWQSQPFVHLFGIYGTTIAWWSFAVNLPKWLLPVIWAIETATYWLTPRPSNKNAALWLQKILQHIRR